MATKTITSNSHLANATKVRLSTAVLALHSLKDMDSLKAINSRDTMVKDFQRPMLNRTTEATTSHTNNMATTVQTTMAETSTSKTLRLLIRRPITSSMAGITVSRVIRQQANITHHNSMDTLPMATKAAKM